MLNRRTMLTLTGAAAAAAIAPRNLAFAAAPFEQPPLRYAEDALAPTISARTVGLHYGKHHKAYFTKLNELVAKKRYADMASLEEIITAAKADGEQGIFDNAGQAWNHNFYWRQFEGGPAAPGDAFAVAADRDFGGFEALKSAMAAESEKVFGTGWVWLVDDDGKLAVLGLQDAGNPIAEGKRPLLGIDVWEHAYYLDYENRRREHVMAVLNDRVNWRFVSDQRAA